jgi:hypothetical protein
MATQQKRRAYKATFTVEITALWPEKPDGVVLESVDIESGPPVAYAIDVQQIGEGVCEDTWLHAAGIERRLPELIQAACQIAMTPERPEGRKSKGRPKLGDHTNPNWRNSQQVFLLTCIDEIRKMKGRPTRKKLAEALRSWNSSAEDADKLHWLGDRFTAYQTSFEDLRRATENWRKNKSI